MSVGGERSPRRTKRRETQGGLNREERMRDAEKGERGKLVPGPPCGNLSQPSTPWVRGN